MLFTLLRWCLRLCFRVNVTGDLSGFSEKRILIVSNHISFLDGLLIAAFLPAKEATYPIYTPIANSRLMRLLRPFIKFVPLDPNSPMSLKHLVRTVESGQTVTIFPEGRLTVTGSLMKVYDGAGFVAAKTQAAIIPVRLDGAEFSYFGRLHGLFRLRLFPRFSIHVLPFTKVPMPQAPTARARRALAGEALHKILMEARMAARPRHTLYEAFVSAKQRYGATQPCIEDTQLKMDHYRELHKKMLGASRLVKRLTSPKSSVGVLLPNMTGTAALIFGVSLSGRVPALLNYTAGESGLRSALQAAQIKQIFTSKVFLYKAKLTHLVEQLDHVDWYFLEDWVPRLNLWDRAQVLLGLIWPALPQVRQAATDPGVILFTSGSEGSPKGVVHSHDSLLANVEQIRTLADFTPQDRFMTALPLFHAFGLTAGLLLPLLSGSSVVLYPNPLHYRIVPELIYDRRCTVLFGTSTFLANYAKYSHPYNFAHLRYVVTGAEKLSESTRTLWIERFGINILEGYGATECAPIIAVNVPMAFKKGTVGRLVPSMEARLIPVPGIEEGGRLQVRGPNLMLGYFLVTQPGQLVFPRVEDEQGHEQSGWYDTGDIVKFDSGGFLIIQGRAKRFAKIAGEMVSLEIVERLAHTIEPNAMHVVSIKADAAKGEALVLFTTGGEAISRQSLQHLAKQQGVPELAVPRVIHHLKVLPLLGSGKPDLATLRQMAEQSNA